MVKNKKTTKTKAKTAKPVSKTPKVNTTATLSQNTMPKNVGSAPKDKKPIMFFIALILILALIAGYLIMRYA